MEEPRRVDFILGENKLYIIIFVVTVVIAFGGILIFAVGFGHSGASEIPSPSPGADFASLLKPQPASGNQQVLGEETQQPAGPTKDNLLTPTPSPTATPTPTPTPTPSPTVTPSPTPENNNQSTPTPTPSPSPTPSESPSPSPSETPTPSP